MESAIAIFADGVGEVCRVYTDKNGDPNTFGADLASLCNKALVPTAAQSKGNPETAVGIGCLAAFAVSGLKLDAGVGTVFMVRPDFACRPDHVYIIQPDGDLQPPAITYTIGTGEETLAEMSADHLFRGTPAEFLAEYGPQPGDLE